MKKLIAGYFRVGTKEQAAGYPVYTAAGISGKDIHHRPAMLQRWEKTQRFEKQRKN